MAYLNLDDAVNAARGASQYAIPYYTGEPVQGIPVDQYNIENFMTPAPSWSDSFYSMMQAIAPYLWTMMPSVQIMDSAINSSQPYGR